MGLWDKLKSLFGGAPEKPPAAPPEPETKAPAASAPPPPEAPKAGASKKKKARIKKISPADDELTRGVKEIISLRIERREHFEAIDIATEVTSNMPRTAEVIIEACEVVDRLYRDRYLAELGYARTWLGSKWVYHREGKLPKSMRAAAATAAATGALPGKYAPSYGAQAAATPPKPPPSLYDASHLLGLPPDELRKRALRINPFKTPWIGRTDVIPPQSDERTALIDRGLILRGLLTQEQIKEIHRIGDLWLARHDASFNVHHRARSSAEDAVFDMRRRRAERKAAKRIVAAERARQRAEDIQRRREEDIVFLGTGVSAKLSDRRSHLEALRERGLPVLSTPAEIAGALGLTVPELRWLCFHNEAADRMHYVQFLVPKRSGGTRLLAAPLPRLSRAQAWILRSLLDKVPAESPAHGFVKGRSTVTNARPHTDRAVVVNLDLSDFFPSITWRRVRGVFEKLGYSPAAATVLALLCTEPPRRRVEYEGRSYWVAVGERALPQGAPTSPALSNLVTRKLDRRLAGMCAKMGWEYTRYADDLTFSAPGRDALQGSGSRDIAMLLARVRHIVSEEGFRIHPKKGRVQRSGGRQSVTGIVVNHGLSLPREEIRKLRAILHNAKKTGLAAQNRDGVPNFEAHIRGKLSYLHMIDPERSRSLIRELDEITGRGA
jgi:hypothetical protein